MKTLRTLLALILSIAMVLCISTAAYAESEINITMDGVPILFDQPPIVQDGRTLVPFRVIIEALGASVGWEQSTQTVTATKGDDTVILQVGSNILERNGQQIELDVPAQVINGRLLVPARAVAVSFGAEVVWNQEVQTVMISTNGFEERVERPTETPPETTTETPTETPGAIRATITMEDGGIIELELYHEIAPQSVRNFVYLARKGFYDGLRFHRIISGFMIQGGCPQGLGIGGPGYTIKGEFAENGFANELKHERGVISMARSSAYDSAGSQFFIMHSDAPGLDGAYASFGRVLDGMDVVDRIAATPVIGGNGEVAYEDMPIIRTITIVDDIVLPEPDMLNN